MTLKENGIIFMHVRKAWVLTAQIKKPTGHAATVREYYFNRSSASRRLESIKNKLQVLSYSITEEFSRGDA